MRVRAVVLVVVVLSASAAALATCSTTHPGGARPRRHRAPAPTRRRRRVLPRPARAGREPPARRRARPRAADVPRGRPPELVDWVDYEQRRHRRRPRAFAQRVLDRAGPDQHDLVRGRGQYRAATRAVRADRGRSSSAARPGVRQLVDANDKFSKSWPCSSTRPGDDASGSSSGATCAPRSCRGRSPGCSSSARWR